MALSAYGTALGSVLSFTTPPATLTRSSPAGGSGGLVAKASRITTLAATEIIGESAILHGSATPSGVEMTGWFRYSTTAPTSCNDFFGTRAPHKTGAALGAGEKPVDYSQAVTGLAPGTTYYYCAIGAVSGGAGSAGSAEGTSFGEVLSLTTRPAAPAVTTSPPTDVAASTATLNARILPRGDATTSWFRYDTSKPENCNDSFGVRAPANVGKSLGSGTSAVVHSEPIFGLNRGETYYFCAIAANSLGTTYGEVLSFIPGATAPTVTTESPISVDTSSGTVGATVYANGSEVAVWFRVGESDPGVCDESFGSSVAAKRRALGEGAQALVALTESPSVASTSYESAPISGLRPGTTYYYCAVASNMGGIKFGQVRSFMTATPPPELGTVTSSASEPIESQHGCSYTAGKNRTTESSPLALLLLLPMLGGLVLRRRLRARAA
jgi:YHS domain-containing protein